MAESWFEVRRFSDRTDLSELHNFLSHHGIRHKFAERRDQQVLWLLDESARDPVCDFIDRYLKGEVELRQNVNTHIASSIPFRRYFYQFFSESPISLALIVMGFIGFLIVDLFYGSNLFRKCLFWPVNEAIAHAQIWRLISPAFLHFDIFHFLFNGVGVLILGPRLERFLGIRIYLLLVFLSAIVGNVMQFYLTENNNFGGLSGVVYGFIGAYIVGHWVYKERQLAIQDGILICSIASLVLGFMGAFEKIAGLAIANGAHLGGFLGGIFCMWLMFQRKNMTPKGKAS